MKQKRRKFIRQDMRSRRDGALKPLLFFYPPGRVARLCIQHIKSLWGTSEQSCGLNSGDLYRKGGRISFSHQRHAGFDILCLTAVTDRIPRELLHCSVLRNRPHSHTGAALYNSACAVLCVWAQ